MIWNDHSMDVAEGSHAFLGASTYSWLNYTPEKLTERYLNHLATLRGTTLHAFAAECIMLRQTLPKERKTLNMYVNDCIGFGMSPEVLLYYSDNCFGTADAINFKRNILRISDLKTGVTPASLHQLEIYAALFCLEYNYKPNELSKIELRIYQNNDILVGLPEAMDISLVMDKIQTSSDLIDKIREEQMQ